MPGDGDFPARRRNSAAIAEIFTGVAGEVLRHRRPSASTLPDFASLSLNTTAPPELPFTEAALSLMCFPSSHLARSNLSFLVESIVATLPVSAGAGDCAGVVRACVDVLPLLRGSDDLHRKLLRAVLHWASSSSIEGIPSSIVSKLHSCLPEPTSGLIFEMPFRSLFWYLDHSYFKHDIFEVLREAVENPLMCMKEELRDRLEWREIVLCLVLQPTFFVEARALLYSWFLVLGWSSVQDFRAVLVSALLDALSRPMWWGLSMEVGLKLPQSKAYFSSANHELLMKLSGPISFQNFVELVHIISVQICDSGGCQNLVGSSIPSRSSPLDSLEKSMKNYNCIWALLMEFPCWFYYATMLLFYRKGAQENALITDSFELVKAPEDPDVQISNAAQFLSWILWPVNDQHHDALVDCLSEISRSWPPTSSAGYFPRMLKGATVSKSGRSLKLKRSQTSGSYSGTNLEILSWLEHIRGLYVEHHRKADVVWEIKTSGVALVHPDSLFRRIPIGILIAYSKFLNEKACGSLLHYVATGEIVCFEETEKLNSRGCNGQGMDDKFCASDKMKGLACEISFLFNLFDIIEDLLTTLLVDENKLQNCMCSIKRKCCNYLVSCIKKLSKLRILDHLEEARLFTDLSKRLERWKCLGGQNTDITEFFDKVAEDISPLMLSHKQYKFTRKRS